VASNPPPDTILRPIQGKARPLSQFLTVFHLVLVVLDPFTNESAWIIETAGRILTEFIQSDCTVGWLVTGSPEECKAFLGPWAERFTTFSDPERTVVKSLGLESLPAIVHVGMDATVEAAAEGWHPREWAAVTDGVAHVVSWTGPYLPGPKDPAPYDGTPALG
jgi:hypothetical protein